MEQITEDGWFQGKDSPVRGIRLYVASLTLEGVQPHPEFTVWITDEDENTIWEKTYYNLTINHEEMVILEEYERGEGIEVGNGRYQIHNTLCEDPSIRVVHKILAYDGSYAFWYGWCVFFALAFLAVVLIVTWKDTPKSLALQFFLAMVLMGILFTMIMPPLTVPDEESHFLNAYDWASQIMRQEETDEYGNRVMRKTDADSITYLHSASSILRWYDTFNEPANPEIKVTYAKGTSVSGSTPRYAYLFSTVGIMMARIFGMNGHLTLLMGRFFNLLGTAAIMSLALYLMPFGKKFFCIFGLFPEIIYLAASYSYDALNFALCFLIIAYFFFMVWDEKQVGMKELIPFLLLTIIMTPIKMVYIVFWGLILLIPRKQLAVHKKYLIAGGVVCAIGIIGFLIWRGEDVMILLRGFDYNAEGKEMVSLSYALQNPLNAIFVFANNLMRNFDYYIKSVMGEFVGRDRFEVLLDIAYLPLWMMLLLGSLAVSGIYTDGKNDLSYKKRFFVIVLCCISCFLFMLSMYLANNTKDMNEIHGIQGRYFLPILLLFPVIFSRRKENTLPEKFGLSRGAYLILGAGIDIVAIFVQLQHITMDYYA